MKLSRRSLLTFMGVAAAAATLPSPSPAEGEPTLPSPAEPPFPNIAAQQMMIEYQKGLVTWDTYRSQTGDEYRRIQLWADKYIQTPEGRAEVLKIAEELRADAKRDWSYFRERLS